MKIRIIFLPVLALSILFGSCSIQDDKTDAGNKAVFDDLAIQKVTIPSGDNAFSWGQYASAGKNQVVMGPCRLFIATALIEAMVRIYYQNPGYQLDLSEGALLSSWAGSVYGSYDGVFSFIKNNGLVYSSQCEYMVRNNINPYAPAWTAYYYDMPDDVKANLQSSIKVTVPGFAEIKDIAADNDLKAALYTYGPLAIFLNEPQCSSAEAGFRNRYKDSMHAFLLVGWRTVGGVTEWEFASDSWMVPLPNGEDNFWRFDNIINDIKNSNGYFSAWRVVVQDGNNTITWTDKPNYQLPVVSRPEITVPSQTYELSSKGDTVWGTFTPEYSGTYYWEYTGDMAYNSGYFLNMSDGVNFTILSNQDNPVFSGSFTATKGRGVGIAIKGGIINSPYAPLFHGKVKIHK
jgi:hypothetical protein